MSLGWAIRFALAGAMAVPLNSQSRTGNSSGPATRPSRLPASRPAATRPSVPAFEPLLDAAKGEWATYSALEKRELRYEITGVTGAAVTTQVSVRQEGKLLGLPALREDPRDFDPLTRQAGASHAQRHMTSTKVEAAGRKWDAWLYEDRWTDEDVACVRRTWVSKSAPVFGIIRMELKGDDKLEARLELKTFGRK